ncbi:MAG: rhomboid family intramembrane serine protease [Steroidobacteraceae bacterium]
MLRAVAIGSEIDFDGEQYLLRVASIDASQALRHLRLYETETRRAPPQPAPPQPYPNAALGCLLYALVLLVIGYAVSNGLWRLDAFELGELDARQVQSGQWWRAWTALTLHLDAAHLLSNLGVGVWFGYLAARQIGNGVAWLLIVSGAALANLIEALFGPATHRAVGASTAVFTALGLLAAHAWRTRFHLPQRWALRWAPLIGGAVLLGWLGTAGEQTDIVAHALGFVVGAALGACVALPPLERALQRVPQWLAGAAALGSIGIAWACALRS